MGSLHLCRADGLCGHRRNRCCSIPAVVLDWRTRR
jgi:hypothetical protein